jgi:hypothetical protein
MGGCASGRVCVGRVCVGSESGREGVRLEG